MASTKYAVIRAAFEALALPGVARLIRRFGGARGVIFTLHRVLPEEPRAFSPNAILQVRPDFLDHLITRVRQLGMDIVTLDEAMRRLASVERERRFVVLTFDDAYRDNLVHALPILRRQQAPFTLYVPTALVDGVGEVWWQALEDIVAGQPEIEVTYRGETDRLPAATLLDKRDTYDSLYWRMRTMPEPERVAMMRDLAARYGLDLAAHCRSLIMDWSELATFAAEPLCTVGAHTVHHYELAKLPADEARNEIEQSVRIIRAQFGTAPTHLSYPIGGKASASEREFRLAAELGLRTAVTTRPGGLFGGGGTNPHALPRVSLNGLVQARRYVDVFATGEVFSAMPG